MVTKVALLRMWLLLGAAVVPFAFPGGAGAVAQDGFALVTPPSDDFRRAADLFEQGRRDEAAFWFYRARLRGRIHLEARPELRSRGDRTLLISMRDTVGRRISAWALADVPTLTATLERVLAWHDRNDDPFTPKAAHPAAHATARLWLAQLLIETQLGQDRERLARLHDALLTDGR